MKTISLNEILLKEVNTWLSEHSNPYSSDIYEKAYWTILDIGKIINNNPTESIIDICRDIFNRFKFYYY